jgi:hypothetical protein
MKKFWFLLILAGLFCVINVLAVAPQGKCWWFNTSTGDRWVCFNETIEQGSYINANSYSLPNGNSLAINISNVNTSGNIKGLGFNYTTELKTYFDTIYYLITNPVGYINETYANTKYYLIGNGNSLATNISNAMPKSGGTFTGNVIYNSGGNITISGQGRINMNGTGTYQYSNGTCVFIITQKANMTIGC